MGIFQKTYSQAEVDFLVDRARSETKEQKIRREIEEYSKKYNSPLDPKFIAEFLSRNGGQ